jgi:tRNA A-37 threonylcarbamoyl transferase component Bud32
MSGVLDQVEAAVEGLGLRVRRAWPRSDDHVLLDLAGTAGTAGGDGTAGQWLADPGRARRVAEETAAGGAGGSAAAVISGGTTAIPGSGVVCQPGGRDRRLRVLESLVADDGAVLISHRPERRAVVRLATGDYAKVVRPGRAPALGAAARQAASAGLRVPAVTAMDPRRGVVTTAALPGRPLYDLLTDHRVPEPVVLAAARATGEALAQLHSAPVPAGAAGHDAAAEAEVAARWVSLAATHLTLPTAVAEPLVRALEQARSGLVEHRSLHGPSLLHRDLHDGQVLVDGDRIGMVDFDLAAAGEPALDLANLLVHLELRWHQGAFGAQRLRACRDAVLSGYRPGRDTAARLPAYALATRVRLVAVYSFRPDSSAAAAGLLTPV